MATTNSGRAESTISSDALGLLGCFSGVFEDVIYRMAEHAAIARAASGQTIEISADDVEDAANLLAQILRDSKIPEDVKPAIDSMLQCFTHKNIQRKR